MSSEPRWMETAKSGSSYIRSHEHWADALLEFHERFFHEILLEWYIVYHFEYFWTRVEKVDAVAIFLKGNF